MHYDICYMISTVDKGHIGVLALLDLSAAFDTVDYVILMETLRRRFGVGGDALGWLADFEWSTASCSRGTY